MDKAVADKVVVGTACIGEEVESKVDWLLVDSVQNPHHFVEVVVRWDCMPVDCWDNHSF